MSFFVLVTPEIINVFEIVVSMMKVLVEKQQKKNEEFQPLQTDGHEIPHWRLGGIRKVKIFSSLDPFQRNSRMIKSNKFCFPRSNSLTALIVGSTKQF